VITAYYTFDFGDCVMAALVEAPAFPSGSVIQFVSGPVGRVVAVVWSEGVLVYRIQNPVYLRDPVAAETAIEQLRRGGWKRVATLKNGQLECLEGAYNGV
jgi:hypothetical protein